MAAIDNLLTSDNVHEWIDHPDVYFISDGKLVSGHSAKELLVSGTGKRVQMCFRLRGGKGGFGSLLRAIGSQIDKTTNREMCRDLTGRRMRDVNNEIKLKDWSAKAGDRAAEAETTREERRERRREQLKLLRSVVEGNIEDRDFGPKRSRLQDTVYMKQHEAAVEGIHSALNAAHSSTSIPSSISRNAPMKKSRWLDELEEDLVEEHSGESDQDTATATSATVTAASAADDNDSFDSDNSDLDEVLTEALVQTQARRHVVQRVVPPAAGTSSSSPSSSSHFDRPNAPDVAGTELPNEEAAAVVAQVGSKPASCAKPTLEKEPIESTLEEESLLDLLQLTSLADYEALGADRLKLQLSLRGLKCGGTLLERAQRLFAVRALKPDEYPPSLSARKQKSSKSGAGAK